MHSHYRWMLILEQTYQPFLACKTAFYFIVELSTMRLVPLSLVNICPGWLIGEMLKSRGMSTVTFTRKRVRLPQAPIVQTSSSVVWLVASFNPLFWLQSMSDSALWVKEKTTEGRSSPQKVDSLVSSGGQSFLMITGKILILFLMCSWSLSSLPGWEYNSHLEKWSLHLQNNNADKTCF